MFDARLRLMTDQAGKGRVLPTVEWQVTQVDSASSTISFTVSEKVSGRLDAPQLVAVEYSTGGAFSQPRNGLFIVDVDDSDDADPAGTVRFSGQDFVTWMMQRTYLHWSEYAKNGERLWTESGYAASAGTIIGGMLSESKARGWGSVIDYDFTWDKDSNGEAWTADEKVLQSWRLLTPLAKVLGEVTSQGLCEWWTEGTTLRLFRPGVGEVLDHIVLGGPAFKARPVKSSFSDVFTDLTVVPEKADFWLYLHNEGASTRFGRLETTMTQSGVADHATATVNAQSVLLDGRATKREYSFDWNPAASGAPAPWVDFNIGDEVTSKTRHGKSLQRVIGIQVSGKGQELSVRTIVGDKLLTRAAKQAKRNGGGSIGGIIGGGGDPFPIPDVKFADPEAPTGLHVESNTGVWREDGSALSTVVLAWSAVSQAVDGSGVDIDRYEVAVRTAESESVVVASTDGLSVSESSWAPGVARFVKVRAVSVGGGVSAWSGEISVTPVMPASIVPKPVTGLKVDSNVGSFLQDGRAQASVTVSWDAVTLSVEDAPVDVAEYEVRVGLETQRVTGTTGTIIVPTGRTVQVRVAARSTIGVWGDPSAPLSVTGAAPAVNLPAPSAPVLTPGMGGIAYRWSGWGTVPAGFSHVLTEVASAAAGPWELTGTPLSNAGGGTLSVPVGEARWFRFRPVDTLGRTGALSPVASATVTGVSLDDIPGISGALDEIRYTADGKNRLYLSVGEPVGDQTNLAPNPSFEAAGAPVVVRTNRAYIPLVSQSAAGVQVRAGYTSDAGAVAGGRRVSLDAAMPGNSYYVTFPYSGTASAGEAWSMAVFVRNDGEVPFSVRAAIFASGPNQYFYGDPTTIQVGETALLKVENVTVPAGTNGFATRLINGSAATHPAGAVFTVLDGVSIVQGPTAGIPGDPDLTVEWQGAVNNSPQTLSAAGIPGGIPHPTNGSKVFRSRAWSASGDYSARVTRGVASTDTFLQLGLDVEAGKKYTLLATGNATEITADTGAQSARRRRINFYGGQAVIGGSVDVYSDQVPVGGVAEVRVTVTAAQTGRAFFRLYNGSANDATGGDMFWDDLLIAEGVYDGPFVQPFTPGDLWFRLAEDESSVVQILVWNGTMWAPQILYAEDIFATGSITGALIQAGTILVDNLHPSVGETINLSANGSINFLVGRADDADSRMDGIDGAVSDAQATADGAANIAGDALDGANTANNRLDQHQLYFRVEPDSIKIGRPDASAELRLAPERVSMMQQGIEVSYWEGGVFVADEVRLTSASVANHKWEPYGAGRSILRPL